MEKHLFLRFTRHAQSSTFDASLGDARVPRERRQDTHGTSSSSSGLVRLTPGPGAALPQDRVEDPFVAHIPDSNYTGYVVMYATDSAMTMNDRSSWHQVEKQVACPHFCAKTWDSI